ncbi:hypothetical protein [Pseudonocardia sp. NPDC046786]|uniref:hypothetical protein n=1 Tax=Pseudonocardia sp. NPDC046786 TaxID=3155471 RepID=UPI0034059EC1
MDGYVDRLRTQFAAVGEVAGDDVRDLAERLMGPLESTLRLVLLEALTAAADEITLDLVPGPVHLRLSGSDPEFVVSTTPAVAPSAPSVPSVAPPQEPEGPVARINFRPPESLKARIEEAAARDGLSVNTWLTRVASAALDPPCAPAGEQRRTGRFG